ncbi:MAG: helix-turn-helix domain-containing protein [Patescibacteria group bacterium]|nr:helix-turn-helix domain-containing protein [Patescibacteria group bacterium]MCL5224342.1 helix-turn-helix domain-containing protein [Patescibacteria group bacterium]
MNEKKDLPELLKELSAARGLNVEKLAEASNIPARFVSSLLEGNYEELPSKPYIRGYIIKLAKVLDTDPDILLESYESSSEDLRSSGVTDRLPANRFALKPINRGLLIAIVVVMIVAGVVIFRFNDIIGKPEIQANVPSITSSQTVNVTGEVKPGDTLTINGQVVYPAGNGTFEQNVSLSPGLNTLQFTVKRFLGGETVLTKQVFYQSAQSTAAAPPLSSSSTPATSTTTTKQ